MSKKLVILLIGGLILVSLVVAMVMSGGFHKRRPLYGGPDKIAIIYVDGVIVGGKGQNGLFGDYGGTDAIIRQLRDAADDSSVAAVVLRINSPGGSAPASQEVGEEIMKLRSTGKIIVTSMADVAASGGYWLAACTDKIYANPATLTGSIGVYIPYSNWEELYKKLGVRQEKIKSGPHKDILSPERDMSAEERVMVQEMVDDMYNQFVNVVAQGRNLDPGRVRQLADGRIFTGRQAKEASLVDELGDMYDAIAAAAELAQIKGEPEIKDYGRSSAWQTLLGADEKLEKIDLDKLLFRKLVNELPLGAPMAMPVKW